MIAATSVKKRSKTSKRAAVVFDPPIPPGNLAVAPWTKVTEPQNWVCDLEDMFSPPDIGMYTEPAERAEAVAWIFAQEVADKHVDMHVQYLAVRLIDRYLQKGGRLPKVYRYKELAAIAFAIACKLESSLKVHAIDFVNLMVPLPTKADIKQILNIEAEFVVTVSELVIPTVWTHYHQKFAESGLPAEQLRVIRYLLLLSQLYPVLLVHLPRIVVYSAYLVSLWSVPGAQRHADDNDQYYEQFETGETEQDRLDVCARCVADMKFAHNRVQVGVVTRSIVARRFSPQPVLEVWTVPTASI